MMKCYVPICIAVVLLSACSASTGPGTAIEVDPGYQLKAIGYTGDTVFFRSSDYDPVLTIQACINGTPTKGVAIVYLNPLRGVTETYLTHDSGIANVHLHLPTLQVHRDTSFIYEFRGYYSGKSSPVLRKIVIALNGSDAPTQMRFRSINESSIDLQWTRSSLDKDADTVVAIDSLGHRQEYAVSSDKSDYTLRNLTLGMRYSISLHTRGGSTQPVLWAPVIRSAVIRLHAMETANGSEIIGISFSGSGFRTVTPSEFDSADIILGNMPRFVALGEGIALLSANVIRDAFRNYNGRGAQLGFSDWRRQSIQDTYFSGDSIAQLFDPDYYWGVYVDTTTQTPITVVGYQKLFGATHYLMIQIDPQPNGTLVGQDAEGRFIDIEVIYQPAASVIALHTTAKRDRE